MPISIRAATPEDEPFLWEMLYFAANMADDGAQSAADAKTHPYLAVYVANWGRGGDVGVIAEDAGQPVGAAWVRQLSESHFANLAPGTPELAIAVAPEALGHGVGTQLLLGLFEQARGVHPAIALSVRQANPARRLYERLGFVVVEEMVNRVGGVSYVMVRYIQPPHQSEAPIG